MSAMKSRAESAIETMRQGNIILPSLLLCDFGDLKREVALLEAAGVQALHLDVMDGQFVPNLTYGMPIVEGIRRLTDMPLDVHLMISEPSKYIAQFVEAGADCITIHAEIEEDHSSVLQQIRDQGVASGLAINPSTPLDSVLSSVDLCDLFLVMSVDAGFGGQAFNPIALEKLRTLSSHAPDLLLEVDGGINNETIGDVASAGATLFVVGSAIFGQPDYQKAIQDLEATIDA